MSNRTLRGRAYDAGGGQFAVVVDFATDGYPTSGTEVAVTWEEPPKFKVGDRVVTKHGSAGVIASVEAGLYSLSDQGGVLGLYAEVELSPAPTLEEVIAQHWRGGVVSLSRTPARNEAGGFSHVDLAAAIREAFPDADL